MTQVDRDGRDGRNVRDGRNGPDGPERSTTLRRVAWTILGLVVVSVVMRSARHDVMTQDTTAIIDGVNRTVECARDRVFSACRYHPDTQSSDINPYPLLQYVPAFVFKAARLGDTAIRSALIWLNTIAIALTIWLVGARARRVGGAPHAVLGVGAVVTGMLVPYAGHSFGEPLLVLAGTALCVQCLADRSSKRSRTSRTSRTSTQTAAWTAAWTASPSLAIVAMLGAMGKETMFASLALFAAAALLVARHDRADTKRRAIAVGAGLAAGVFGNVGFNVFRFGGIRNVQYLRETRPGIARAAANTVSLIVAPNGGLLWFWCAGAVAVGALTIAAVRPRGLMRRDRLGALSGVVGFGLGLVSLGLWWGPFGWYSWGPRLLLPFVVPVIVLALEVFSPGRRSDRHPVRSVRAVVGVGAFVALLMVPNLGDVWNRDAWISMQLATAADRPWCANVSLDHGSPYAPFHECLMDSAWRLDHMPLVDTLTTMPGGERVWFWTTAAGAVAALGAWLAVRWLAVWGSGATVTRRS